MPSPAQIFTQEADLVVNNSTVFVDTEWVIPLLADKFYYFEMFVKYSTLGTADSKYVWKSPIVANNLNAWGSWDNNNPLKEANDFLRVTDNLNGNNIKCTKMIAYISPTTNGSVTFQFAQNVAIVTDTIFQIGSTLMMWEV